MRAAESGPEAGSELTSQNVGRQLTSKAIRTPAALVHLDLYRLEQSASADELFCQEEEEAQALGALMAVEWPGRLSFKPEGAWALQLDLLDAIDPEAGRVAREPRFGCGKRVG